MQPQIALKPEFKTQKQETVAIVVGKLPKPMSMKVGAQGLLDVAINNAMASGLDKHLAGLDISRFNRVGQQFNSHLTEQGFAQVQLIEDFDFASLPEFKDKGRGTGFAGRDFRGLAQRYQASKIITLNVAAAGTLRAYYGFIPLEEPRARFMIEAQLVNLKDNSLEWYSTVDQVAPVVGPWDQPEAYPNLTKAFYGALGGAARVVEREFTGQATLALEQMDNEVAVTALQTVAPVTPVATLAAVPAAVAKAEVKTATVPAAAPQVQLKPVVVEQVVSAPVQVVAASQTLGKWSYEVEQIAKEAGCMGDGAWLVGKDGLDEHYRVVCKAGPAFNATCTVNGQCLAR
ncbi:hypothetical protein [Chitinimonas sp. JJ19]|uniref:hypothetical protein n=1 Tax=Chitinimonas sp. JJ19 TaxID=3109352 RepID=UPI001A3CD2F9|nr:hypothetical protein [Chitinimonas sp.]